MVPTVRTPINSFSLRFAEGKVYRHAQPNEVGWKLFDSMIESTIILVHLGQGITAFRRVK
jgi:hypothetical protein